MSKTKNSLTIQVLSISFFSFTYIASHSFVNLFYRSTTGPDYEKYKQYLDFFFGYRDSSALEQGLTYYYLVATMVKINLDKNIFTDIDLLYSFSIQSTNLIIYTFGILGFFYLLKFFKFNTYSILLVLGILNLFPPAIGLRLTMKPEILSFALLPWCILLFEKYLESNKREFLIQFSLLFCLLISLKISISAMIILFYITKYFNDLLNMENKEKIIFVLIILIGTSLILLENYNENDSFLTEAEHDAKYNNKASPLTVIKLNPVTLLKEPYEDKHKDSMLGIFLLDTFDDYFNLYWNQDISNFKKYRKQFLQPSTDKNKLITLDFENRILTYSGPFNFYLNFLRQYFAIILTLIFYVYAYKSYKKNKEIKLFISSPLLGILILIVNNVIGFPKNNFDPLRGDTFKTFYIAIFLCLSFVFVLSNYLKKVNRKTILMSIFYSLIIIFILGFPKANNSDLDSNLSKNNNYSIFCEVNRPFLINSLFETSEVNCKTKESKINHLENIEIAKHPIFNISFFVFFLIITLRYTFNEISNYLKISKYP
ncbi:MAG: hypothetical protein CMA48_00505 [Euryarchaeota archaeon]|nr:hypothetical protein [Euryarchaeota archaeon]